MEFKQIKTQLQTIRFKATTVQACRRSRLSADCPTIFRLFKVSMTSDIKSTICIFLKKVAETSMFFVFTKIFEKSRWTVTRQWLRICQTTFFGLADFKNRVWPRPWNNVRLLAERSPTVVGGHATVGWLSIQRFWTFPIRKLFVKTHRRVKWLVTRPSADCPHHACI